VCERERKRVCVCVCARACVRERKREINSKSDMRTCGSPCIRALCACASFALDVLVRLVVRNCTVMPVFFFVSYAERDNSKGTKVRRNKEERR
jgi:hypothetical protein